MTHDAVVGDWDTDFADRPKSNQDQDYRPVKYLNLKTEGDHTVRIVGNYVRFLRWWAPFPKSERVITCDDYRGEDPAMLAGFRPKETFAIHVIDRTDGEVKLLEKGPQIFEAFARYKAVNNVDPASINNGPDFVINVDIPNGNTFKTTYTVTAKANATPLTKEEQAMVKENFWPLKTRYAATALEKIKELWEEIPPDQRIPEKKGPQGSNPSVAQETTASDVVSPDAGNDLFADEENLSVPEENNF